MGHPVRGRAVRDWLGSRAQVHRGVHPAVAERLDRGGHGGQPGTLGLALKSLPLGTAYAVWTGIGAVGTVLLGIFFLGDLADLPRLLCIGLILAGIVGLKLVTPA